MGVLGGGFGGVMEKFLVMIGPRKVPNCYTRILCACSILEGAGSVGVFEEEG